MYIILATFSENVSNPYYYPGIGRHEPEYIVQENTKAFEVRTLEELGIFIKNSAKHYNTVKYYEAKEVVPELVTTIKFAG